MEFSPLIIGTMRWGIWGANHSEKQVSCLIETCVSEGLKTFDHADIYGNYTTEKLFGDGFKNSAVKRSDVQLISKCGIEMPCENRNYDIKSYNYSKEHILKSVDKSLQNLGTEYLDVLLLHRPSPLMNPDEIAEIFYHLKENGKVLGFGVSNFSSSQFNLIHSIYPLVTNQVEISLNNLESFSNGTLDQMLKNKIQPMAYSVLGNYFQEKTEENFRIKKIMMALCDKYNAEENQILLAFLLKHPSKILPVIGTSRVEMIKQLKKSVRIDLDREDWFRLLEAKEGKEVD